jgi:methionine synthase II (cobalamin-independent)
MSLAGPWAQLKSLSAGIEDPQTREAVRALEELVRDLIRRLADAERRIYDLEP